MNFTDEKFITSHKGPCYIHYQTLVFSYDIDLIFLTCMYSLMSPEIEKTYIFSFSVNEKKFLLEVPYITPLPPVFIIYMYHLMSSLVRV